MVLRRQGKGRESTASLRPCPVRWHFTEGAVSGLGPQTRPLEQARASQIEPQKLAKVLGRPEQRGMGEVPAWKCGVAVGSAGGTSALARAQGSGPHQPLVPSVLQLVPHACAQVLCFSKIQAWDPVGPQDSSPTPPALTAGPGTASGQTNTKTHGWSSGSTWGCAWRAGWNYHPRTAPTPTMSTSPLRLSEFKLNS